MEARVAYQNSVAIGQKISQLEMSGKYSSFIVTITRSRYLKYPSRRRVLLRFTFTIISRSNKTTQKVTAFSFTSETNVRSKTEIFKTFDMLDFHWGHCTSRFVGPQCLLFSESS